MSDSIAALHLLERAAGWIEVAGRTAMPEDLRPSFIHEAQQIRAFLALATAQKTQSEGAK